MYNIKNTFEIFFVLKTFYGISVVKDRVKKTFRHFILKVVFAQLCQKKKYFFKNKRNPITCYSGFFSRTNTSFNTKLNVSKKSDLKLAEFSFFKESMLNV